MCPFNIFFSSFQIFTELRITTKYNNMEKNRILQISLKHFLKHVLTSLLSRKNISGIVTIPLLPSQGSVLFSFLEKVKVPIECGPEGCPLNTFFSSFQISKHTESATMQPSHGVTSSCSSFLLFYSPIKLHNMIFFSTDINC